MLTVLTIPGATLDLYREAMLSLQCAYEEIDWLLVRACGWRSSGLPSSIPYVPIIRRDLPAQGVVPHDSRLASAPVSIIQYGWPHLLKILGRIEFRESLAAAARMTFRPTATNLALLEMESL